MACNRQTARYALPIVVRNARLEQQVDDTCGAPLCRICDDATCSEHVYHTTR